MVINQKELKSVIEILSRSEERSSIRNEFFHFFKGKKNKKLGNNSYNRIYHFVFEISKKRNWIDEIISFQKVNLNIDFINKNKLVSLYRLVVFIYFVDVYETGSPEINKIINFIPNLFPETRSQVHKSIIEELRILMEFNYNEWLGKNTDILTRLSMKYFHPEWLISYLQHYWDQIEIEKFLDKNNQLKESSIRIIHSSNDKLDQIKREIISKLKFDGIIVQEDPDYSDILTVKSISNIPISLAQSYLNNEIVIQSKISSLISHLLNIKDYEIILDMAAAPGMKSGHISNLMGDNCTLISVDISQHRILQLKKNLDSQTKKKVNILLADSGYSLKLPIKNDSIDKILLDAPCSSTGIFWKYPDHKWHQTEKISFFADIQRSLIKEAIRILKYEGIGIYSVCSIHYSEGEAIINDVLDSIELIDLEWGNSGSCFPYTLDNLPFSKEISKKCRRTFSHIDHSDCFFIAKFKKIQT